MIVTATQMKISGIFGLFRFFSRVRKVKNQLSNVGGLVFLKISGLSTMSGWDTREAMQAFRNNADHLDAMKHIKSIGKAKSITWEVQNEPDWPEAKKKLNKVIF